uniref:Uncharacterized protein n=1 Tax=viral metagenome TaxID=1070528 RepID=A0A6C0JVA7_9ZZZZ
MRRELFFVLLVIIGLLLWQYSVNKTEENFQDFVMPKPNPQPTPVAKGDPLPFAPSSTSLLAPPPGQTASVNSYPADDPAQKKANAKRIKNLLQTLNGFLSNEGPGLSQLGDPAVQIPLQTARADARRLTDEVSVIDRNPGVESSLTDENVNDIDANLTYLQKKWRLSANSMSGAVEGFQGFGISSGPSINTMSPPNGPSGAPSGAPSGGTSSSSMSSSNSPPGAPSSLTYHYKGIIPDFPSLPTTGNTLNDYYLLKHGYNPMMLWNMYALWNGSTWLLQGFPTYSIIDTVHDINEMANMRYNDFTEGTAYKIYNKVGPYTMYLVWMGGTPGPVNNAPQDIIDMMNYVYSNPNTPGIFGNTDPIKTGSGGPRSARFAYILTTSSANINTLITDIFKSQNPAGVEKGTLKSVADLPSSNNLNTYYYMVNVNSTNTEYLTWRLNSWIGVTPLTFITESFQTQSGGPSGGPSGNPNRVVVTPALLAFFKNLLSTQGSPSGGPSGAASGSASGRPSPSGGPSGSATLTLAQLITLQTNILATITRLTSSGSTNPLLTQRINVLEIVLHNVDSFITQINRGTLKEADIPITLAAYNAFLPFVDPTKSLQLDQPLPNLIRYTGASSALMSLFPYYMNGDVSGAELARSLFDKYAAGLFNETSYEIGLKFNHKSESERRIAESVARAALNPIVRPFGDKYDEDYHGKAPANSGERGEMEKHIASMSGSTDGKGTASKNKNLNDGAAVSTVPAVLDWKARSQQICDQISKRGLDPNDYGCLKNTKAVDENFSFRGYARMICSRLGTNYDPGIPDLCGCPPPTWPGWRP